MASTSRARGTARGSRGAGTSKGGGSYKMAPGALVHGMVGAARPGIITPSYGGGGFYNRQLGYGGSHWGRIAGYNPYQSSLGPQMYRGMGDLFKSKYGRPAIAQDNWGKYRRVRRDMGVHFLKRGADFEDAGSSKDTTKASLTTLEGKQDLQPTQAGTMGKLLGPKKKPTRMTKTGPLGLKKRY